MPSTPMPIVFDLDAYPAPHLAVDLVLVTICDGALKVMMMERAEEPFAERLVLPGGFVHPGERLDDTARRVLAGKTTLTGARVEQLYTFSAPERDPRGWVVSVAYFALVPCQELVAAIDRSQRLRLVTIMPAQPSGPSGERERVSDEVALMLEGRGEADSRGDQSGAPAGDRDIVIPGFDHHAIITMAVQRLRGKLDWSMVAFELLPKEFTLFELQRVHELILGYPLLKPPFRKKMLDRTFADGSRLVATGRFSRAGRHRPAELYRLGAGKPD